MSRLLNDYVDIYILFIHNRILFEVRVRVEMFSTHSRNYFQIDYEDLYTF